MVEIYNNRSFQDETLQWLKAIAYSFILMGFMMLAHATDATGIQELDKQATAFQTGVKMFAKWGGILMVVIIGIVFASGQAQGQMAKLLLGGALGIGIIAAAWGWFSDKFTQGFAF